MENTISCIVSWVVVQHLFGATLRSTATSMHDRIAHLGIKGIRRSGIVGLKQDQQVKGGLDDSSTTDLIHCGPNSDPEDHVNDY